MMSRLWAFSFVFISAGMLGCGRGKPVEPHDTAAASGQISIPACAGLNGVSEKCTLVTNASACTKAPCTKLVVIFSGGEMGCDSGVGYRQVMDGYASKGYAAVCINYFESAEGSGISPYVDEAPRIDLAVREATRGNWARTFWTGEHLLFEGISHGATAPVVLMARTDLDSQPHWRGAGVTAGCFFDGSYDQLATANLLASGAPGGRACNFPVPYSRWLERYCGSGATASSCDLGSNSKALEDNLTSVSPHSFFIRDFKMFECGSALPACSGDIVAGEPIETLCRVLESSPAHNCSFVSLPSQSHLKCHAENYGECLNWFEAKTL